MSDIQSPERPIACIRCGHIHLGVSAHILCLEADYRVKRLEGDAAICRGCNNVHASEHSYRSCLETLLDAALIKLTRLERIDKAVKEFHELPTTNDGSFGMRKAKT